jgi:hypothetical protein
MARTPTLHPAALPPGALPTGEGGKWKVREGLEAAAGLPASGDGDEVFLWAVEDG